MLMKNVLKNLKIMKKNKSWSAGYTTSNNTKYQQLISSHGAPLSLNIIIVFFVSSIDLGLLYHVIIVFSFFFNLPVVCSEETRWYRGCVLGWNLWVCCYNVCLYLQNLEKFVSAFLYSQLLSLIALNSMILTGKLSTDWLMFVTLSW